MRLSDKRRQVQEELTHIWRTHQLEQSELRMQYWARRMHSLGKKASSNQTATEVLRACLDALQEDYPDFSFQFDSSFFQ